MAAHSPRTADLIFREQMIPPSSHPRICATVYNYDGRTRTTLNDRTYPNGVCSRDRATWTVRIGRWCCPPNSKWSAARPAIVCTTAATAAVTAAGSRGRTAVRRSRSRSRRACGPANRRTCWTGQALGTRTRCTRTGETSWAPADTRAQRPRR